MILKDYIDATRIPYPLDSLARFNEYYAGLYHTVVPSCVADLYVVRTFNKLTQLVTFSGNSYLIQDQYLGQTLSEMTRIFLYASSPADATYFAFRIMSESATCCGYLDLAQYFAALCSHHYNEAHGYRERPESDVELAKRIKMVAIQEAYIIAHEVAHYMWRHGVGSDDPEFVDMLLQELDAMDDRRATDGAGLDDLVETYLNDLSFNFHGEAIPHSELASLVPEWDANIRERVRRQFVSEREISRLQHGELKRDQFFREEIFADRFAMYRCVEAFSDNTDVETLVVSIHLALENLTSISLVMDFTEWLVGLRVSKRSSAIAARKYMLRSYCEREVDLRRTSESEDRRSGHRVITEANQRYMRLIRDPMTLDSTVMAASDKLPAPALVAIFQAAIFAHFGEVPLPHEIIEARSFSLHPLMNAMKKEASRSEDSHG